MTTKQRTAHRKSSANVEAREVGYGPEQSGRWSDEPQDVADALDNIRLTRIATVSPTAPTNPVVGQLWLDESASGIGSSFVSVVTITSDTMLTVSNEHVRCDTSGGPITVTLPATGAVDQKRYSIKNIGGSAVTIDADGAETIDSGLTAVLNVQDESINITAINSASTWDIT